MIKLVSLVKNINTIKKVFISENLTANFVIKRLSSFKSSHIVRELTEYPEVEVIKNPPEWKYVEMLLGPKLIPEPSIKSEYPSGWKPVTADPSKIRYFVSRTKNHMMPIYLKVSHRGERRLTIIRRIDGDIWLLEKEIREHVESNINKVCATRINELCGQLTIHGDHVNLVKKFLVKKGF